jgi:hypothetical protein
MGCRAPVSISWQRPALCGCRGMPLVSVSLHLPGLPRWPQRPCQWIVSPSVMSGAPILGEVEIGVPGAPALLSLALPRKPPTASDVRNAVQTVSALGASKGPRRTRWHGRPPRIDLPLNHRDPHQSRFAPLRLRCRLKIAPTLICLPKPTMTAPDARAPRPCPPQPPTPPSGAIALAVAITGFRRAFCAGAGVEPFHEKQRASMAGRFLQRMLPRGGFPGQCRADGSALLGTIGALPSGWHMGWNRPVADTRSGPSPSHHDRRPFARHAQPREHPTQTATCLPPAPDSPIDVLHDCQHTGPAPIQAPLGVWCLWHRDWPTCCKSTDAIAASSPPPRRRRRQPLKRALPVRRERRMDARRPATPDRSTASCRPSDRFWARRTTNLASRSGCDSDADPQMHAKPCKQERAVF